MPENAESQRLTSRSSMEMSSSKKAKSWGDEEEVKVGEVPG